MHANTFLFNKGMGRMVSVWVSDIQGKITLVDILQFLHLSMLGQSHIRLQCAGHPAEPVLISRQNQLSRRLCCVVCHLLICVWLLCVYVQYSEEKISSDSVNTVQIQTQ